MHTLNSSKVEITTFFLIGIPGLEHVHVWISVPICLMYLVAILGNCTILFAIRTEPSLHAPVYYFLSKLAVCDLRLSLSSLCTMLLIFALNATGISPSVCFAQEFFIHGFTNLESLSAPGHDFCLLFGHPQPPEIQLHPPQCQSGQNGSGVPH